MPTTQIPQPSNGDAASAVARFGHRPTTDLIAALAGAYRGRIALVSSFGADAAVLLHLVARADPATPVLFLDTGHSFAETLAHRAALTARLGLTDVRTLRPDPAALAAGDPEGWRWATDPDGCCALRKLRPLRRGLEGFDLWTSGRKRHQAATRAGLPPFEDDGPGRIKANLLAAWSAAAVEAYRVAHDLPPHPLVARGFPSIGCRPCTNRVRPGEDPRAGRWRGRAKVECGIHARVLPAPEPSLTAPLPATG